MFKPDFVNPGEVPNVDHSVIVSPHQYRLVIAQDSVPFLNCDLPDEDVCSRNPATPGPIVNSGSSSKTTSVTETFSPLSRGTIVKPLGVTKIGVKTWVQVQIITPSDRRSGAKKQPRLLSQRQLGIQKFWVQTELPVVKRPDPKQAVIVPLSDKTSRSPQKKPYTIIVAGTESDEPSSSAVDSVFDFPITVTVGVTKPAAQSTSLRQRVGGLPGLQRVVKWY